jgi:hypothetical protein
MHADRFFSSNASVPKERWDAIFGGQAMPFKKQPSGKYKSPSGKTYTKAQVKAYYAKKGAKAAKGGKRK